MAVEIPKIYVQFMSLISLKKKNSSSPVVQANMSN
jgi:hypothetical protein